MGCCLTTAKPPKSNNPDAISLPSKNHHPLPPGVEAKGGAPPLPMLPPPSLEEETVKEVLSETPVPKPVALVVTQGENGKMDEAGSVKIEAETVVKPAEEVVSEISEMCSFTESFSTTTMTENRDDEGEVSQRVVERSPSRIPRKRPSSGDISGTRGRGVRSAANRAAPSPEKRSRMTSRAVQGRVMMTQGRNVGPQGGIRRNPGEISDRRSKSPAARGDIGGPRNARHRSPSLTPSGRAGNRVTSRTAETNAEPEIEKRNNDVVPPEIAPETSDSIENPLVSLECFIFL